MILRKEFKIYKEIQVRGLLLLTCLLWVVPVLVNAADVLEDRVNSADLHTVMLYPFSGNLNYEKKVLNPPIISLGGSNPLVLEFDDLRASFQSYTVKIIHCGFDWMKSSLRDLEYLNEYNEYFINQYEVSQGTKVPYYHFTFRLPAVKLSGNYVVQVLEGGLGGRVVIQKRFRVFESAIGLTPTVLPAQDPALWRTHQQAGLRLNFRNYPLRDPKQELKVVIRQNYRDDRMIQLDARNALNSGAFELIYRFFNNESTFAGGSEFRFFDIRNTYSRGNYVQRIINGKTDQVILSPQGNNSQRAYLETQDLDGRFLISNMNNPSPDISSDYVEVLFRLRHEEMKPGQKVFILGQLTNWHLSDEYLMQYAADAEEYQASVLLKQGIYDYKYVLLDENLDKTNEDFFEGNHSDTQNAYEFFIYHQPPSARSERLVGYTLISDSRKRD